jgi:hypothetical protein
MKKEASSAFPKDMPGHMTSASGRGETSRFEMISPLLPRERPLELPSSTPKDSILRPIEPSGDLPSLGSPRFFLPHGLDTL